LAGHNSSPPVYKHGSTWARYPCTLSANMVMLKVALPWIVSRPVDSKMNLELRVVTDALKVVALFRWEPGHGDGGPEERTDGLAFVCTSRSDHESESKESFIMASN